MKFKSKSLTRLFAGTLAVFASLALLVAPAPASAAPSASGGAGTVSDVGPLAIFHISNRVTGRCIDDSFEYGLRAIQCYNNAHQAWDTPNRAGGEPFRNLATGRCIDDSFEYGFRTINCNGGSHQRWHIGRVVDPWRWYQNHVTGGCWDDSFEYGFRSYGCNGGPHQDWLSQP
jgi:hypothetical protein